MPTLTRPYSTLMLLLVLAIGGLAFQSRNAPLILDDVDQLQHVMSFRQAADWFGPDAYGLLRPIKNLMFWPIRQAGTHGPQVAHATSLLAYIMTALLLLLWIQRLFKSTEWAAVGAAIWALSPTQVSCLTWVSCANILICVSCMLASLCIWDARRKRLETEPAATQHAAIGAAMLLYAVGFFAYEVAITLPILLVLQDRIQGRKIASREAILQYAWPAATTILLLAARWLCVTTNTPDNPGIHASHGQITLASAFFLIDHLKQWILPFGKQEILGTFVWGTSAPPSALMAAWVTAGALLWLAFMARRRAPLTAFGIGWFLITFLPMSNLIPLRVGPFADYYLALPSIGLAIATTDLLRRATARARRDTGPRWKYRLSLSVVIAVIAWRGSSAITACQWARSWNTPEILFRQSIQSRPCAFRSRTNLARHLKLQNSLPEAETLAFQAQAEAPWYAAPCNVLGDIHNQKGDHGTAKAWYAEALARDPSDDFSRYALAYTCETWLNEPGIAEREYGDLVRPTAPITPYKRMAYLNLSRLYAESGRAASAVQILERATVEFPRSRDIRNNLAMALRDAQPR
jgi:hypothetical protein